MVVTIDVRRQIRWPTSPRQVWYAYEFPLLWLDPDSSTCYSPLHANGLEAQEVLEVEMIAMTQSVNLVMLFTISKWVKDLKFMRLEPHF